MGIYEDLGVRTFINGNATLTRLGGSLMSAEVLEAMAEAAECFVDIEQLQKKAGARIAEWTRNEAAYVSCGAAAGLALATAACIAGTDPDLRERLPYSDGMKNEIIVHAKFKAGYDFAIRQAGGKLIEIGDGSGASEEQLEEAISENTAALFYFANPNHDAGQVPIDRGTEIAHDHGIPVVVDAAAQIPPAENLWSFTHQGADVALFSGGKGLRGPQASGLLVGTKALIDAAAFHACPNAYIGRPMKVGKEEIVGLMQAIRIYLDTDHAALMRNYEDQVQAVIEAFRSRQGIIADRGFPSEAGQPMPRARLEIDESVTGVTRDELLDGLLEGDPAISIARTDENGVFINPQTLRSGEMAIIIERIEEILSSGPAS